MERIFTLKIFFLSLLLPALIGASEIGFSEKTGARGKEPHIIKIKPRRGPQGSIVKIIGNNFGRKKGTVIIGDEEIDPIKWNKGLVKIIIPETVTNGKITLADSRGREDNARFKVSSLKDSCKGYKKYRKVKEAGGRWQIFLTKKWVKYEKDPVTGSMTFVNNKEVVVLLISMDSSITINDESSSSLFEVVDYIKDALIDGGRVLVSSMSNFFNCEGDLGYKMCFKTYLPNGKPFFEWIIYFFDSDRILYQINFASTSKKKIEKKKIQKVLKSFRVMKGSIVY